MFKSPDDVISSLEEQNYIIDKPIAVVIFLSICLKKPLLLEGETGVGKTELAKAVSSALNGRFIRLQCYEGIDANQVLYEWNYPKQLLKIRLLEKYMSPKEIEATIYSKDYLEKRPLYEAISTDGTIPPVLLVDEIDRADEDFEAFLLEYLSDFQISIPELGTIKSRNIPIVILTSNRTRELHDAIKRRCLYMWIDFPSKEKVYQIILKKVPRINETLAAHVTQFMHLVRELDLEKKPGLSEIIDWAESLVFLHCAELNIGIVKETLGFIIKNKYDIDIINENAITNLIEKTVCKNTI